MPGFRLRPDVEPGGPCHVGARRGVRPGRGVQPAGDRDGHQLVPGGMEFDLVNPVPVPVMTAQRRGVLVRQAGLILGARRSGDPAKLMQATDGPGGALPRHGLQQGPIAGDIVTGQRRYLVEDLVSGLPGGGYHLLLPRVSEAGQVWMPHSVLAVPAQRPLRGSAPASTRTVQVRQPTEGYPS